MDRRARQATVHKVAKSQTGLKRLDTCTPTHTCICLDDSFCCVVESVQRFPRAPGWSSLCHSANIHQLSILHRVMFMLHCYSPNSSHPLLPPLSPQVCPLCLFLYCCPVVHPYHLSRFHIYIYIYIYIHTHTYMLIYDICFSDLLHSVKQALGSSTSKIPCLELKSPF